MIAFGEESIDGKHYFSNSDYGYMDIWTKARSFFFLKVCVYLLLLATRLLLDFGTGERGEVSLSGLGGNADLGTERE